MSREIKFQSIFSEALRRFIKLKQLSGTEYSAQALNLKYFDEFLMSQKIPTPSITQGITTEYARSCSHLAVRTVDNRLSVLRQFCIHLSQTTSCYIPDRIKTKRATEVRTSCIFSKNQICRLLDQAKKLPKIKNVPSLTYYTLFAILYGTGMRIGEVIALNIEDVHVEKSHLYIKQGKFRKSRWVPMSLTVCAALRDYLNERQRMSGVAPHDPLFISLRKNRIKHCRIHENFKKLLIQSDIQRSPAPRIHDLRHTFAVHRLLEWYREKQDINSLLPSLATYMGHVNMFSTQYYLQSTPELLAVVSQNFETHYNKKINRTGARHEQ